jgi:hypothetical protein
MEAIFKGENILEFSQRFFSDEKCREFITQEKWKNGYACKHCGHKKYFEVKKHCSRECTKCKYIESATAGTLFHKLKFGLQKSFLIIFEMSCTTKGMSSLQIAKRYGITQKTAWFFMQKVKIAMESSKTHPMTGTVHVDEFVIGGKETGKQGRSYDSKKSKVVCAIELAEKGKIKRGYAKVIDDYSANSIEPIFKDHISLDANIKTDKWTAYKKLSKKYLIVQEKSKPNENFKQMHTIIQQIKSEIRTIQTHVNRGHLQKYLDEYFFRLNRSIYKETIFNKLFERMVNHSLVFEKNLVLTK